MDPSPRSPSREARSRARQQTCYRADLPERLRTRLAEHGLSQAKLSQDTNIDPSTLSKILNGKRRPNAAQLGVLAYVLGVELDELLVLPSSPNELDELRADRDEATRRADEAEAARRREETARVRAELAAADRISELVSLRAQRDEAIHRADELENAYRREETARVRAESAAAERVAELEAKLEETACARQSVEAQLKRVEQELAAAKVRLGQFDFGEPSDPKPRSGRSGSSRSTVELVDLPRSESNERLAAVQRTGEMIEAIGVIGGKIGSLIYRSLG
jgi:transcriptional regulator with XRE-family HTH domain